MLVVEFWGQKGDDEVFDVLEGLLETLFLCKIGCTDIGTAPRDEANELRRICKDELELKRARYDAIPIPKGRPTAGLRLG